MKGTRSLFDLFGGIRPMADALGEAPSTVHRWKGTGRIPAQHQSKVLVRAIELALPVTALDVIFPLGAPAIIVAHLQSRAIRFGWSVDPSLLTVACDRAPIPHREARS